MNRLYQNGMLSSGEPRHFAVWEFPSVPKLQPIDDVPAFYGRSAEEPVRMHSRGLGRLLRDVLRVRP